MQYVESPITYTTPRINSKRRKNKCRIWTEKEDNYLKKYLHIKEIHEIAESLRRPEEEVQARITFHDIQEETVLLSNVLTHKKKPTRRKSANYRHWTIEEDKFLIANHKTKTDAEIGLLLGRTALSVKKRRIAISKTTNGHIMSKQWSQEEIEFLDKNIGKIPLELIAKKLGRTYKAVRKKIHTTLGTTNYVELSGCITTSELSYLLSVSTRKVNYWIQHKELPALIFKSKSTIVYGIKLKTFFNWLSKHKEKIVIDFSEITLYPQYSYPTWFKEEVRQKKVYHPHPRNPWTEKEEMILLEGYFKNNLTHKEIGIILGRSTNSVSSKCYALAEKMRLDKGYSEKVKKLYLVNQEF